MNKLANFREIANVVLPNSYNDNGKYSNDVALVEVKVVFKYSASVKPACLPTSSELVQEYDGQLMVSVRINDDRRLVL